MSLIYSGFSIDIILYDTKINIVNQTNNLYSYSVKYNIKNNFKSGKLEKVLKRFAEEHPDVSGEQLQALKDFYKNASEKEINEILFETTNERMMSKWTKLSIIILILGVFTAYFTKSWWPMIVSVVFIPIFMVLLIYLNTKYLEKYADISLDEQEILNELPWLEEQSEPKEKEEIGRENL